MSAKRFSRRTAWPGEPSALSMALSAAESRGQTLIDLTQSNPTQAGLQRAEVLQSLADEDGLTYAPEPQGLLSGRQAVADYYERRGLRVDVDDLFLSASTSESYTWLFKLLCDPGDVVLVPQPSYPLFPFLAQLEGVELDFFPLLRNEQWRIDEGVLRRKLASHGSRARAIVLVNPSNPCGNYVHKDDAALLRELSQSFDCPLIVDEVFWDYALSVDAGMPPMSLVAEEEACCFVMSGLSKGALLPQLKLAWIALSGPETFRRTASERLEIIADTYLSVSTPVQLAASNILANVDDTQHELRRRLLTNLATVDSAIEALGPDVPVRRLPCEGGWYVLLEVPRTQSDDEWVEQLIRQEGIVTYPGYMFGVVERGVVVLSLLVEPDCFADAVGRAVRLWARA